MSSSHGAEMNLSLIVGLRNIVDYFGRKLRIIILVI